MACCIVLPAILYDRHVEHRGVRSKFKTHAQPHTPSYMEVTVVKQSRFA